MADIGTAAVSASAVLIAGYATSFVAERYRRFLDSRSIASALLGELTAHSEAFPDLETTLARIIQERSRGTFRVTEVPTSPVFEKVVEKIGHLGHPLAGDVAYAYERIRAFRSTLMTVVREGKDMDDAEYFTYLRACRDLLADNRERFSRILRDLELASSRKFGWLPFPAHESKRTDP